ncbi:MAG: DUF4157 domain-containing protein, partial [Nannocystaceae bacterium]
MVDAPCHTGNVATSDRVARKGARPTSEVRRSPANADLRRSGAGLDAPRPASIVAVAPAAGACLLERLVSTRRELPAAPPPPVPSESRDALPSARLESRPPQQPLARRSKPGLRALTSQYLRASPPWSRLDRRDGPPTGVARPQRPQPLRARADRRAIGRGGRPHARGPPKSATFLESEADAIAVRALRGETALALEIHRAPSARPWSRATPGAPLPSGLRFEAERRLGVDLRHVRVHADHHAGVVARRHGVCALTFGTDIVLGAGQYRPHTLAGRRLLFHELVHVVQQTARSTSDGLRCEPDRAGSGAAQPFTKPVFKDKAPSLAALGATHTSVSSDARVKHWQGELAVAATKGTTEVSTAVASLRKEALAGSASKALASYAYDANKADGQYFGAVLLSRAHQGLQTTFHDPAVVSAQTGVQGKSKNKLFSDAQWAFAWLPSVWEEHPLLATVRPKHFVGTVTHWLMGMTRSRPTLGMVTPSGPKSTAGATSSPPKPLRFQVWAASALSSGTAAPALREHESFVYTLWALAELDQARRKLFANAEKYSTSKSIIDIRVGAAKYIYWWSNWILDKPLVHGDGSKVKGNDGKPLKFPKSTHLGGSEVQLLGRWLGQAIQNAADAATAIWQPAIDAYLAPTLSTTIEGLGETLAEFTDWLSDLPELSEFYGTMQDVAVSALRPTGTDDIPSQPDYEKHNRKLSDQLKTTLYKDYELPLLADGRRVRDALMANKAWDAQINRKIMIARAYAYVVLRRFKRVIDTYHPKKDKALAKAQAAAAKTHIGSDENTVAAFRFAADYRANHRRIVALTLVQIGREIGDGFLVDEAMSVLQPIALNKPGVESVGSRARFLVIHGDFYEDQGAELRLILDDIGSSRPVRHHEPLRIVDIYRFLTLVEWTAASTSLASMLRPGGTYVDSNGDTKTNFAPKDVIPNVLARERELRVQPKRWLLDGFSHWAAPDIRSDFAPWLFLHPKTRLLGAKENAAKRTIRITPVRYDSPVVLWALPSIDGLTKRLRDDPSVAALVSAYYASKNAASAPKAVPSKGPAPTADGPPEVPEPTPVKDLSASQWLLLLAEVLEQQIQAAKAKAKAKGQAKPKGQVKPKQTAGEKAVAKVQDKLEDDLTALREKLVGTKTKKGLLQDASIRTRQYYTERLLRPLVQGSSGAAFDETDVPGFGKFLKFNIAERVATELWTISSKLSPLEDQDAHQTAMVVALAPDLKSKWSGRTEFDLIATWLPIVDGAIKALDAPSKGRGKSSSLDVVQTSAEKGRRSTNKKHLADLLAAWIKQIGKIQVEYGLLGGAKSKSFSKGWLKP